MKHHAHIGIDMRTIAQGGGCATYLQMLVPRIIKRLPHVTVHLFFIAGPFIEQFAGLPNVVVHRIPLPKIFLLFYDWFILPFYALRYRFAFFHGPKSALSPLYRLFRIPTVVTIHDIIPLTYPESEKFVNHLYWKIQIPLAYKWATSVITISEFSRKQLEERWGKRDQCMVIYHGGGHSDFLSNRSAEWKGVAEKFGISKPFVLYVGTIQPRKNVLALVQAYANDPQHSKYQLVIAGKKGWLYNDIFAYVKKHQLENDVVFTGFISEEEKTALFEHAELFAYLSSDEGFGMPIIEAMAHGTPVVTANASCLPEIGGDAAVYVDPKNSESILEGIHQLLGREEMRQKLIQRGRENSQRFNWDTTAEQTIEVYNYYLK